MVLPDLYTSDGAQEPPQNESVPQMTQISQIFQIFQHQEPPQNVSVSSVKSVGDSLSPQISQIYTDFLCPGR